MFYLFRIQLFWEKISLGTVIMMECLGRRSLHFEFSITIGPTIGTRISISMKENNVRHCGIWLGLPERIEGN